MTTKKSEASTDVYLVIADESEGFQAALRYVARLAKESGARLAILHVMEEQDIQPWAGVARRLHGALREETEQLLMEAAKKVHERTGLMPGIYVEEGGRPQKIIEVINNDPNIKKLVLGAEANASNPGPLVSYFTGKGLSQLRVPLTIVPGSMTKEMLDNAL